jgi:hypothetical protein
VIRMITMSREVRAFLGRGRAEIASRALTLATFTAM